MAKKAFIWPRTIGSGPFFETRAMDGGRTVKSTAAPPGGMQRGVSPFCLWFPPRGIAARPTLKMCHWHIFLTLRGLAPPAEGRSDEDNINIYRQKATPDRIQNGPGYFYEKMELVQPHRRAMAMVKILQEVRSCSTLACSLAACILGSKPGNSQPKATPPGMSWT